MKVNITKKIRSIILLAVCCSVVCMPSAAAGINEIEYLVPMGNTVAIKLETEGLIVAGLGDVQTAMGVMRPAAEAGIKTGDIIVRMGSVYIRDNDDLRSVLSENEGEELAVLVKRNGREYQFTIKPALNTDGLFEMGMWLRDEICGIGTMTFYDPETKTFGALGHAIADVDTGLIVPLRKGIISDSVVTGIRKGTAGTPGELKGEFDFGNCRGTLSKNSRYGIFGTLSGCHDFYAAKKIPIAAESEIKLGPAKILSNICASKVGQYEIEITRLYSGDISNTHCMMIKVTDENLLSQTGGIVQGMSGSPIIQDGKIIGAITHVIINDPTKGYGISIQKMLDEISCQPSSKAA